MTHDLHTMTGAYALDALDQDESREFEAHLDECEPCAREVRELRATGAMLGLAASAGVPSSLRDAVMAQVRTTRQLPPVGEQPDDGRVLPLLRRARTTSRALLAVAAALVVIAGALGAVVVRDQRELSRVQQAAAAMSAVISSPDAKQIDAGGAARVIMSASQGKAVFVARSLPEAERGRVLQLWVLGDGAPRSVGIVNGTMPLVATGVRSGLQLGVTVEPAGGSKSPTTEPVMTMTLL